MIIVSSIKAQLLTICVGLVLLTSLSISITYYILVERNEHQTLEQRIRIAFTIILDDLAQQRETRIQRLNEFLTQSTRLHIIASFYNHDHSQIGSSQFLISSLAKLTDDLKQVGALIAVDRLALYAADHRLLAVYQHHNNQETTGGYVISSTGQDTYLSMDDFASISKIHYEKVPIPDIPLPEGILSRYSDDFPATISSVPLTEGDRVGLRILAPLIQDGNTEGMLIGDVFYTQTMAERYATLSETEVNFFANPQWSFGTLSIQKQIDLGRLSHIPACEELSGQKQQVAITLITLDQQEYQQGQCVIQDRQGPMGAITVSLSRAIEKQQTQQILVTVITISVITTAVAFGLSALLGHKAAENIQNLVKVIGAAADGDLRQTVQTAARNEFRMLADRLNQMIAQLRTISRQVQSSSHTVNATADTILQEMTGLMAQMQEQSSSVENSIEAIDNIARFMDTVTRNTGDMLDVAAQVFASIREMRASEEEVSTSTGFLTSNLHLISASIDQVNQAVKQIGGHTHQLEIMAQHTATEMTHIDQSLQEVAHNAEQTQLFATETMDAAMNGQTAVDASFHGMQELRTVVGNTAQIIREVNTWGERVSSILDIVDEVTEQTALLALNAAIISAQAGVHGRGFAVVADEIKELANRTKNSTKEIYTLVHELQKKTEEGVKHTEEGLQKAEQGMSLTDAVKESFQAIVERATRSSRRVADTVEVIRQTVTSSQTIKTEMNQVTEMVAQILKAIQQQTHDVERVVGAVENLQSMSEQVNRATVEQKHAAEDIEQRMGKITEQFDAMSHQTEALQQNFTHMVTSMNVIETITEEIVQKTAAISGNMVPNLVEQSTILQQLVKVFKVSS